MKALRLFTTILLLSTCLLAIGSEKPNIIIIFVDDMGFADPSCFGNPLIKTPNIDALAQNGIKFTNFYVNSPICSPSRAALNTGQYPMRNKIHSFINSSKDNARRGMDDFLDPNVNTLAKTLKANGYATAHIGKWHLGGGRDVDYAPLIQDYGFDKSFTSFEGLGDRVLFNNHGLSNQSAELGKGTIVFADKCDVTEMYVDSAIAFIARNGNDPFFLHLFPDDVHDYHVPRAKDVEKFKAITENPYEQKFLAVLEEMDIQLGRFIDELRRLEKFDNTIILFTSDNGPTDWGRYYNRKQYPEGYNGKLYAPGFAGPFSGRKWSLFEGGIRMPFIAQWAGHIQKGSTDSTTVMSSIDLYPTICSLLGLAFPDNLDGTDKSKALLGNPIAETTPVMWEYGSAPYGSIKPGNNKHISPNLAIRHNEFKLLINADSTNVMLFNLKDDPGEKNNIANANPKVAAKLSSMVLKWRREMPVSIKAGN